MIFKGVVVTGLGEGKLFMQIPLYKRQFASILGYVPFEGTLNLKIKNYHRDQLPDNFVEIMGLGDFAGAKTYRVKINKETQGAVVVPDKTSNDPDVIEIISPANLREKYDLQDGDIVEVELK